jgi:hypothetical protein
MAAAPKAAQMAVGAAKPRITARRSMPAPGYSSFWALDNPNIPSGEEAPLLAVAADLEARVVEEVRPFIHGRGEQVQEPTLDLPIIPVSGLRAHRKEAGFHIQSARPSERKLDGARPWRTFPATVRREPSLAATQAHGGHLLSKHGGPHQWPVHPIELTARVVEIAGVPATERGELQILKFAVNPIPASPVRHAPVPHGPDGLGPPLAEPDQRHPPAPVRIAGSVQLQQEIPDIQTVAKLRPESDEHFSAMTSQRATPPVVEGIAEPKQIPYLHLPGAYVRLATTAFEELRTFGHKASPPRPDALRSPKPASIVRELSLIDAMPELETRLQPGMSVDCRYPEDRVGQPPMVESAASQRQISYLQVPEPTTSLGQVGELLSAGHRASAPRADLMPLPEATNPVHEIRNVDALPEIEARLQPGMSEGRYLEDRMGQPPMMESEASQRQVSYLQVPEATTSPGRAGELRNAGHRASPPRADLMPLPEARSSVHEIRKAEALPEIDVTARLRSSTERGFPGSRLAQPPMMEAARYQREILYVRVLDTQAWVLPLASTELRTAAHRASPPRADLLPSGEPVSEARKIEVVDALPDSGTNAQPVLSEKGRFPANRFAPPPMVTSATATGYCRPPALATDVVPDATAAQGIGLMQHGHFRGIQDRTMQLPELGRFSTLGFVLHPAALSNARGSLPSLDLDSGIRLASDGSFSQFQNRTAQPPMFTHARTFGYGHHLAIGTAIPDLPVGLPEVGAALLVTRQRPDIREADSAIKPLAATPPVFVADGIGVGLDPRVASFVRTTQERAFLLAARPGSAGTTSAGPASQRWTSSAHRQQPSAGFTFASIIGPPRVDFAPLAKPHDSDTRDSAETLRERIFDPIARSHFRTVDGSKLKLGRVSLRKTQEPTALDFRLQRRRSIWDRAARWKREYAITTGAPVPKVVQDWSRT